MSERQGIEIDYCPSCRGVWLDRGELDKIIERSGSADVPERVEPRYDKHDDYHQYGHKKKKREGFLGDLFDF